MLIFSSRERAREVSPANFGCKAMSKDQDRTVFHREDGKWANKRQDAERPTSLHETQEEAVAAARENLRSQGGGELTIMGRDGKIRSKDTIAPGNDPNRPKDGER